MQQHFTSIAALGRSFHLGELYNYRSDKVLNGKFKITTLRMYYVKSAQPVLVLPDSWPTLPCM